MRRERKTRNKKAALQNLGKAAESLTGLKTRPWQPVINSPDAHFSNGLVAKPPEREIQSKRYPAKVLTNTGDTYRRIAVGDGALLTPDVGVQALAVGGLVALPVVGARCPGYPWRFRPAPHPEPQHRLQ